MRPLQGLAIEDQSNVTEPNRRHFQVRLEDVGTDSCLLIDYADPEDIEPLSLAYGNEDTCSELYGKEHQFKLVGELERQLELDHYYPVPGNYVVSLRAGNQLPESRQALELVVLVMEIDCRPPLVQIKNRVDDFTNATEVWRSKPIQLYAKTHVDCNASIVITRVWEGFLLDPDTGEVLEIIDLTPLDSYTKTFLYVPPFYLKKGIYLFQFSITLRSSDNSHPLLPFHTMEGTHVNVVPSPIIGQMSDGAQSRVIRGWGQTLRLAPGNFSLDPDDKDNKNFTITWFCRRLPDEQIERATADEDHVLSGPIVDRKPGTIGLDGEEDKGGCFGKGPGRLSIDSGEIVWNTTYFYAPAITYEIVVRIDPPDRKSSWTGIQLVLLERSPPAIKVKCQTEALCYPHVPLGQKINPVRVGLLGVCSETCDGQLSYEWTIFGVDKEGNDVLLEDAAEFVVGEKEEKMALGKEFFERYYPRFGDFFAKLAVSNEEGVSGESDIFLHINQPPEQGECTFTQLEGNTALLDKFSIVCDGWMDPELKPIEYYAFWLRNLDSAIVSYLMYGPDKEAILILPYGNFTVGVDIKDKEGSLTRLNVSEITTIAPNKQEFDAFMDTKQLENADAAGDQAKMNMVSQAISSLMNIRLIDPEDPDELTTTTTTTTTTTASPVNGTDEAARLERLRLKRERELEESSKTRSMMVKSIESIMNCDTLNSLEQIGSVLTAIAGKGKGVDNEAKEIVIRLLNKTVSLASTIQVESPQQLLDFCMFAVGTMGGIVNVSYSLCAVLFAVSSLVHSVVSASEDQEVE